MNTEQYFLAIVVYTILQRLSEVLIAKRNTRKLLERGATEFGAKHYPLMVLMHTLFFLSLISEFALSQPSEIYPGLLLCFVLAQAIRFWVMRALGDRWTTRVLVVKGETLVSSGPYRYFDHPNYIVVAIEIVVLPLAFGLWITAISFSILNAAMLLLIRIPIEQEALKWSQTDVVTSLNSN